MAVWTQANLADEVLEYIGVKPAGQSAFGEHADLVKKVWASVHDQMQDTGLAPFTVNAIPDWAKWPLVKYLAVEVGPRFGKAYPEAQKEKAVQEMASSRFGGPKATMPTPSKDY